MTPFSFLSALRSSPFIGILRGIQLSHIPGIANCCKASCLSFVEVTMNTPNAPQLIAALRHALRDAGIEVGAGTVRTIDDLHIALEAGAQFIVTPNFAPAVVTESLRHDTPIISGALTPTEIHAAFETGTTCVKVFPAKAMGGPSYFKELRGPFHDIPLLACGGVDTKNVNEYFASGADAVAFGGSIFRLDWLEAGDYTKVTNAIQNLRESAGKA